MDHLLVWEYPKPKRTTLEVAVLLCIQLQCRLRVARLAGHESCGFVVASEVDLLALEMQSAWSGQ